MTTPLLTDTDILAALAKLAALTAEYDPAILAARRIAFERQIERYNANGDGLWKSDPNEVEGTSHVSFWEDERNSRPFPY